MTDQEIKKDLLSQLLYEAQAYKKFEDIEKLVEAGMDLSMIPIQPLYVSLQNTEPDQVAMILPKLSPEQRQALRDIDYWQKDTVDPNSVAHWIEIYSKVNDDEVILEFVKSEDFLLTFKNQFTIQTFDAEDPMYPDGNNYFLTEDNQLLIEYPEDFSMVQELKEMIRRLYADIGVENAYAFLFKMVVDSYQLMEEEQYQEKKERLRDFGFVDYFDALAYNSPFMNEAQIDGFIKTKKGETGDLDAVSANQSLHASSLVPYQSGMEGLKGALEKVADEKRQQFLHFNFVRLVNARMTLEDALKNGSLAMTKVGNQTRQCLELGFEYTASKAPKEVIFERFDFVDLYKIGHSLIEITKKKIKKAMGQTPFEEDEFGYFLGMYWNAFLENSHEDVAKYKFDGSSKPLEIRDLPSYELWNQAAETFTTALPFVVTFFKSLENLKANGLLNDQFYLNYEVDNIDFEAIMISSFINFVGGHYQESSAGKMGVTISELTNFYHKFFKKNDNEYLIKGEEDPVLREQTALFIEKFGLTQIPRFDRYLYQIMLEQLNGYEVDGMEEEDFRHIGGPILLNYSSN
ncbi:DUF6178 family protein [Peredibacter starrii]|uniref:DUF6178 family protein n=1 Tax=Peredibacter starrii TaxID=28202 RepID=A0AAX4HLA9_9BACT|nr:DUF6178 family protein [Peredibacter starrii]WPU64048.1 DUF6178 family protein [Peredibacter starrii]